MHQASSICFVTNQHTAEVEALLTRQISIIFPRASFSNFEISRFSDFQASNFENVEFGRFGTINPVQNRLGTIRTAFRSLQNHSEIVRVWIGHKAQKLKKFESLKIWKRRAPKNNRYLSGQKCFNYRGVLTGDKTDA